MKNIFQAIQTFISHSLDYCHNFCQILPARLPCGLCLWTNAWPRGLSLWLRMCVGSARTNAKGPRTLGKQAPTLCELLLLAWMLERVGDLPFEDGILYLLVWYGSIIGWYWIVSWWPSAFRVCVETSIPFFFGDKLLWRFACTPWTMIHFFCLYTYIISMPTHYIYTVNLWKKHLTAKMYASSPWGVRSHHYC